MYIKNYQQINKKIALASIFILIIFSASIISKLVWQVLEKDPDNNHLSKPIIQHNTKAVLLPNNLFGLPKSAVKQQHNNIKGTKLNLTLIGILGQNQQSLAIIRQGGGKDKIYKINDFIDSATLITEIHTKYVILSRNGGFEKLTIKHNKINLSGDKTIYKQPSISAANKSKLTGYLQQLNTNPKQLLSIVSVKPNYTKNGMRGFIVSSGAERKLFTKLGFKNNDIITSINNIELNNISQAIKLRKELSKQTYFDFMIERKGQILPLSINLN